MIQTSTTNLEIIWTRLEAAASEMATTLTRTAFSTVVRVNRDFSCAIFDRRGMMLAQYALAPGQMGSMPNVMHTLLEEIPPETLSPGDVIVTNDPWIGCGHTPDIYVCTPVFAAEQLTGFAVTSAHHKDVGGRLASHESREVFEEGLILPFSYLYQAGQPNQMLLALMRRNVRYPDTLIGDLRAQIAANDVGARRLVEIVEQTGSADLTGTADEMARRTEASLRRVFEAVPDGTYSYVHYLDEIGDDGAPLHLNLALTIDGDRFHADFAGTSPQVERPINSVFNYSRAYTFIGVKMALAPELPTNEGFFRAIEVYIPERSLLNPAFPAAVRWRTTVGLMVPELVFMALAQAVPGKVMAGSGTIPRWHQVFSGHRPESGEPFQLNCHFMGGLGARQDQDGLSVVAWPANLLELPVEIIETETPLQVTRRELRPDSGGAGRTRGGLGQTATISYPPRPGAPDAQTVRVTVTGGRFRFEPPGLHGGLTGAEGSIRHEDTRLALHRADISLEPGQAITFETPGGGGFNPPTERHPEQVLRDVLDGRVSVEAARRDYSVVVDLTSLQIDEAATAQLRKTLKEDGTP